MGGCLVFGWASTAVWPSFTLPLEPPAGQGEATAVPNLRRILRLVSGGGGLPDAFAFTGLPIFGLRYADSFLSMINAFLPLSATLSEGRYLQRSQD